MLCPGLPACDNPGCRHGGCQGRPIRDTPSNYWAKRADRARTNAALLDLVSDMAKRLDEIEAKL